MTFVLFFSNGVRKKLVVGLGNLEERYDHTRHNVGFHWLDGLANLHGLRFSDNKKFFGLITSFSESGGDVWLLTAPEFT